MAAAPWDGRRWSAVGTVYLLHFSRPYRHARHYLGFTCHLERRIRTHRSGHGAALVRAAVESEIELFVARRWRCVTRVFERRLRRCSHRPRICPICRGPGAFGAGTARRDPHTEVGQ
jgi:predicted GIY-YIG superfamily endonuclease